jgi:hypothetical protein
VQGVDFFSQPGGKVAGDERNEQEQRYFNDLFRVLIAKL